jgi:hypothetical protein
MTGLAATIYLPQQTNNITHHPTPQTNCMPLPQDQDKHIRRGLIYIYIYIYKNVNRYKK